VLAKLPESRSARWDLVRQIAASYRRPGDDFKAKLEGMDAHLAKLAVSIPPALQEWYAVAAELTDLWGGQDSLLGPGELYVRGDGLAFAAENQYCWECGILLNELEDEDPRVVRLPFEVSEQLTSPAVSVFALQFLLSETFWSGRHSHMEVVWSVEGEQLEYLLSEFQRCDLPDLYLWSWPTRFYEDDGVLLRLECETEDQTWLGVAAQDAETFDEVMDELKGVGIRFETLE
jgi:hypothetical protein